MKKMYLVCFNLKEYETYTKPKTFELARALLGPTSHCEICFITDYKCDAFLVTAHCPDGLPVFFLDRYYDSHGGKYDIVFYKFQNLTYKTIREARKMCQKIVNEQKYKMSLLSMMASTLPKQFSFLYKFASKLIFNEIGNVMEYPPPHLPIYCVQLCSLLLNQMFPECKFPDDCNSSDLVVHLSRAGLVEKVTGRRPDRMIVDKSEDDDDEEEGDSTGDMERTTSLLTSPLSFPRSRRDDYIR